MTSSPIPTFPSTDYPMEPIEAANGNEWATKLFGCRDDTWKQHGSFVAAEKCMESIGDSGGGDTLRSVKAYIDTEGRNLTQPINTVSYICVSGPGAQYVDVAVWPASHHFSYRTGESKYLGWNGSDFVEGDAVPDDDGNYWYRLQVDWSSPYMDGESGYVFFAKTYRYEGEGNAPDFKIWAFTHSPPETAGVEIEYEHLPEYDFASEPFSVMATVSPKGVLSGATGTLVSKLDSGQSAVGGWELALISNPADQPAGQYLSFSTHGPGGSSSNAISPLRDHTDGASDHPVVTAVREASGKTLLYLDGEALPIVDPPTSASVLNVTNERPIRFGKLMQGDRHVGYVKEASLWKKALSAGEARDYATSDRVEFGTATLEALPDVHEKYEYTGSFTGLGGVVYSEPYSVGKKTMWPRGRYVESSLLGTLQHLLRIACDKDGSEYQYDYTLETPAEDRIIFCLLWNLAVCVRYWKLEEPSTLTAVDTPFHPPTLSSPEVDPTVTIDGLVGGVFKEEQPQTTQLWIVRNPMTQDTILTTDSTEKDSKVGHGWTVCAGDQWAYPAAGAEDKVTAGRVPLRCLFNSETNDHRYTSDPVEASHLEAAGWAPQGVTCYLLPLDVEPPERDSLESESAKPVVRPLVQAYKHEEDDTVYSSEPTDIGDWVGQAAAEQPTDVGEVVWQIEGVRLDRTFGSNFGEIGRALGEVLEVFDIKVESASLRDEEIRPAWGDSLAPVYDIPDTTINKFARRASVFSVTASAKNLLNPGDRLRVEVEIKLFHRRWSPGFQIKVKFPGNQCLDRFIPGGLDKGKGIPVVGKLGITDPTFIFATVPDIYDPSLDAGIMAGFNVYCNINLIADQPADQDRWLKLISDLIGVKAAALHLGLGLPNLIPGGDGGPDLDIEIGFIAELALQLSSWNIAPTFGLPDGSSPTKDEEDMLKLGLALPCIETDSFSVRLSRSDLKIEGKLKEGAEIGFGLSADLALELEENEMLGLEKTSLVLTGGMAVELDFGGDDSVAIEPTFFFTMNGTGRNKEGSLTGTAVNTTSLSIDRPPLPSFDLAQLGLELGVGIIPEPPFIKPNNFGVAATLAVEDVAGTLALKIDIEEPTEFMLVVSVSKLTLVQMFLFPSFLAGLAYQSLPQEWRDKVNELVDIDLRNVLVYIVPKPTTIAGIAYEQKGVIIAATLQVYGWEAKAWLLAHPDVGIVLNAEMDPLKLEIDGTKVFALEATGEAPREHVEALSRYALPEGSEQREGKGPRLYCEFLTATGTGNYGDPSVAFLVDAKLYLLGARLEIMASLHEGEFEFELELDLVVIEGKLTASFTKDNGYGYPRLTGGFAFKAGTDLGSLWTPLGDLDLGKLGFGLATVVDIGGPGPQPSFKWAVTGYVDVPVVGHLSRNFTITVTPSSLEDLGDEIKDQITDGLGDGIVNLFHNAGQFGLAVGAGFIELSSDAVGIMRDQFGAGYDQLKIGLENMGDIFEDGAGEVKDLINMTIASAGRFIDSVENGVVKVASSVVGWFKDKFGSDPDPVRLEEFANECASNPNRYWALQDWDEMIAADRTSWVVLGWHRGNWEGSDPNPSSMGRKWAALNSAEQSAARDLAFNQETWDFGFDDPYTAFRAQRNVDPEEYWPNFHWAQLNTLDKENWGILGWNEHQWDNNIGPASEGKNWNQLINAEREAARLLGYDQAKWDAD